MLDRLAAFLVFICVYYFIKKFGEHWYPFQNDGGLRCPITPKIWKTAIPEKIKIFLWLAMKNKILTAENLKKRGWEHPSSCVLCGKEDETVSHLFLSCQFSRQMWSSVRSKLNLDGLPDELQTLWTSWRMRLIPKEIRQGWDIYFAAFCWTV